MAASSVGSVTNNLPSSDTAPADSLPEAGTTLTMEQLDRLLKKAAQDQFAEFLLDIEERNPPRPGTA